MDTANTQLPEAAPAFSLPSAPEQQSPSPSALLNTGPFRHLWIGSTISQLGDVGFMVALPWLVLHMTGSSLALGSVMMTLAIPRALLLLVGGAISDRYAARTVLAISYSVQALCVGLVGVLIWRGMLHMETLYLLAFCFGVADAFTSPALHVLLPQLVPGAQLARANALIESSNHICLLAGAAVAGLLIERWGLLWVFIADAVSYLYIIVALLGMAAGPRAQAASQGMRRAIADGLRHVWRNDTLRTLLLAMACINFCVSGALQVGLAVLANFRFASSVDFGLLMSCAGVGSLAGLALAGIRPAGQSALKIVIVSGFLLSLMLAALAIALPLWWVAGLTLMLGALAGYVNIQILSWLQNHVERAMLGRVMSVLAFASAGVIPLSLAISGLVAQAHVNALFLGAGALLLLMTSLMYLNMLRAARRD